MGIKGYSRNRKEVAATPQTESVNGTVENNAGGQAFAIDIWQRLDRFLVLGSEGGTYYVSEHKLTKDNAKCIEACFKADPERTAARIHSVSDGGLAPKNDPAIFALAIGVGMGGPYRAACLPLLSKVCRIGTHLFHFMEFIRRADVGMGRSVQRTLQGWYVNRGPASLASQLVKYQSRDGWSHANVLALVRPTPKDAVQAAILGLPTKGDEHYLVKREGLQDASLTFLDGFLALKAAKTAKEAVPLIETHGLPRECVPTALQKEPEVWAALLDARMGLTAMVRNLGNMSKSGFLVANSDASRLVAARLGDEKGIADSRIHPLQILLALAVYKSGQGFRGKGTWTPVPSVVRALGGAFYAAFKNVQPTGKRLYLGLDVSGSMGSPFAGSALSCREASVAMAMVTARTESDFEFGAFGSTMIPFSIAGDEALDDACRRTAALPWQGTDCSLPMLDALKRKVKVDAFICYTDNETWAGKMHPFQALKKYRNETGIDAKLIVVGMTATEFSIADPSDAGMLDVVGFDASAPSVISGFVAGRI